MATTQDMLDLLVQSDQPYSNYVHTRIAMKLNCATGYVAEVARRFHKVLDFLEIQRLEAQATRAELDHHKRPMATKIEGFTRENAKPDGEEFRQDDWAAMVAFCEYSNPELGMIGKGNNWATAAPKPMTVRVTFEEDNKNERFVDFEGPEWAALFMGVSPRTVARPMKMGTLVAGKFRVRSLL